VPSLDFVIPLGQLPLTVLVTAVLTQADDEVDPAGEVVPLGQEAQAPIAGALAYVPAAQVVQDVFPVPEAYVPAVQFVQDEAPSAEYFPAAQAVQVVLVFVPALYVPAAHFTHVEL